MSKATSDIDQWLRLWAGMCRSPGVNLGYPKQVNFYTPPMNYSDEIDPNDATSYDFEQASRIDRIMIDIRPTEPVIVECVREYYGAYPTAAKKRSERLKKIDLPRQRIYDNVDRGRYMIKGALSSS